MKLLVDSAIASEISELNDCDLLDGSITNPSLVAKSGHDFKEVIVESARWLTTLFPPRLSRWNIWAW